VNRRRSLAAIAAGLFLATFAFLYAFRNEGIFHLDAVFLAQAVEDLYAHGRWRTDWRFGAVLANALVYFPFWLRGEDAERATILSSLFFHATSIPMAFLFIERLSGRRLLAALAAGLLAVAPVYTIANTFGKEYGLAIFLVVTSFYFALTARATGNVLRAAGSALLFALSYIVWEGLLAITPLYFVVLFAPHFEPLVLDARTKRLAVGGLVGFSVGVAFDLTTSLHSIVSTYANSSGLTTFGGLASPNLRNALSDMVRLLGWPFLGASALGLVLALHHRRYTAVLPIAGLLVATLAFYGNLSTYGPRYLVLCVLGLCMLAGAAFDFLLGRGPALRIAAVAAYAVAIGVMLAASYPLLAPRHTYNGAKRFAQLIAQATEPESVIIVMDDSRFVEYYAHRTTLQHPIGDRVATQAWIDTLRETLTRRPVYLAASGLFYDPGDIVEQAIDANFTRTVVGSCPTEDYHHAEGRLKTYDGHLWRLTPK
ncbi:MAG: hypothetical protein ABI629_24240, partial [bacterium]